MSPLRSIDEGLWVAQQPLRYLGLEVGARMTVVRLGGGGLFVHSPIRLDEELRGAVTNLGEVRFIVAPNRWHHLFVGEWAAAWPGAEVHLAPGLERKRPDLRYRALLDDQAAGWGNDVEQVPWRGVPLMNETAFFHRATRSLVLTDLAHHMVDARPGATRLTFKLLGAWGRFDCTLIDRLAVRDRTAARASLERVLAWDFDRVIVAHGLVLETGGREALRRAYAWLGSRRVPVR